MRKNLIYFILFLIILPGTAFSQDKNKEKSEDSTVFSDGRFQFGVGLYFPTKSIKFRANGKTENEIIDFSKTFNFNSNEITASLYFNWYFAKRWVLSAEYYSIRNSHKAILKEDFSFGDITFTKGSYVKGGFIFNILRAYVGYAFVNKPKHQFGGGIGIHGIKVGPYIEGDIKTDDNDHKFERAEFDLLAPLPNIGLWYYFSPHPKWTLTSNFDILYYDVAPYNVKLFDLDVGVNYRPIKYLGIFASYRFFRVNAGAYKNGWDGNIYLTFNGPTVGIIGFL